MIPRTRNHAGFPGGISGSDLLGRMREQAAEFGLSVTEALIEEVELAKSGFIARASDQSWTARSVLLATGVVNNRPPISPEVHDVALDRGLLRYCPICDGYEVTDRNVGVIGTDEHGLKEALFLRMYTPHVTLIAPATAHMLSTEQKAIAAQANIRLVDGPCQPLRIAGDSIIVPGLQGEFEFDAVYPALGSVIRSELAMALGAEGAEDGSLVVDTHQRTTIPGLYAAGDVAKGLDQISHAMGEAGVAATTIRNELASKIPLLR